MTRSFHMCVDVRGVLRWGNRELKGLLRTKTGEPFSAAQVREILQHELSIGHERLPIGKCDNFDWKTGCRGHIVIEPGEVTTA